MNTLKNAGKHTTLAMYVVRDSIQIITINIQPDYLITLEVTLEDTLPLIPLMSS